MSADTPSDPFTAFWAEFMKSAGSSGAAAPPPSNEATQQLRKVFFDTMAAQADQFMRSEAFLSTMKHAMDNSLAWQKACNDMLQQGLAAAQVPSRADADHMVTLVRGMEERILGKLSSLSERIDRLERPQEQAI